jgi:hypothetical protein
MIFHDISFKFVYHYLDEVVIYSEDFSQHLQHFGEFFSGLRDAGLTMNPAKLVFAVQEICFLGHRVSPLGVSIDPERTRATREFPPPKDARGIARFIGMVNFYHHFVPKLAEVAAPLNESRKKGTKFACEERQQKAFKQLKLAISRPRVLGMADFSKTSLVQTDASRVTLAAVLLQENDGGRKLVAYVSRTLSAQVRKALSAHELECLAVVFGMGKFRQYLEHLKFLLGTDNQALSWLLNHPRQVGKLGRCIVKISSLKFKVQIQAEHKTSLQTHCPVCLKGVQHQLRTLQATPC